MFSSIVINKKVHNKYDFSFILFFIGLLFYFAEYIRHAIHLDGIIAPRQIIFFSVLSGPFFMFLSMLKALQEGKLKSLMIFYRKWYLLLIFIVVMLLMSGTLIFSNGPREILFDFIIFPGIFAGILAGTKTNNINYCDKLIRIVFFLSTLFCILKLGNLGARAIQSTRLDRADYTWDSIYYIWGLIGLLWPYVIIKNENRRSIFRNIIPMLGTSIYFIMAIIYGKRQPFVQLALFLLLIFIKARRSHKYKFLVMSALVVGIVLLIVIGIFKSNDWKQFQTAWINRFSINGGIWNKFINDDRISYDPLLILTQFSGIELLLGRGLGGVVRDVSGFYPVENTPNLHNGAAFIVLKGGLLLLIVWAVGWLRFIKDFLGEKNRKLYRFYIPYLIIFMQIFYSPVLSDTGGFVFLMMCSGFAMSNKKIKINNETTSNIPRKTGRSNG